MSDTGSVGEGLKYRARILDNLDYDEASARLAGLLNWMESKPEIKPIVDELDSQADGNAILGAADYHHPPRAGSDEEIAAVGLALTRAAREHPLYEILHIKSIHGPGSSDFQDNTHAAVARYIRPFVDFVLRGLAISQAKAGKVVPSSASERTKPLSMNTTDVFIVHGHDEAPKQAVARFLDRLALNPIILHEQSNRGRTVIEKFEDHAEVQFAVVILTPDDVGRLATEDESANKFRARQNVVFEMGYFLGRIGRSHVFPLKVATVDIPSDYAGVVYTEMDSRGAWKGDLVRELKGAGFAVDANKVFD